MKLVRRFSTLSCCQRAASHTSPSGMCVVSLTTIHKPPTIAMRPQFCSIRARYGIALARSSGAHRSFFLRSYKVPGHDQHEDRAAKRTDARQHAPSAAGFDLTRYGITVKDIRRNLSPALLYTEAIQGDIKCTIADTGALIAFSGDKTGRSPKDKRVVEHPESKDDVWWGSVNVPIDDDTFETNRERAIDYLNTRSELYVVDAFAGWDPTYRAKMRVICTRPYHAPVHAQHADSPHDAKNCAIRRARRRDLQRGRVSREPANQGHDVEDQHRSVARSARSS